MIEKANLAAKPVITATQMLESMLKAPRPTRAEASDVANAVLDGTDAVMLSGETANGQYPLNAVRVMARTCCEAERTFDYKRFFSDMKNFTPQPISTSEAIAASAVSTVLDLECDLILILTDTGNIARLVSKYRPPVPILACCVNNNIIKSMQVIRGVQCFKIPTFIGVDGILQNCIKEAKERGLCKSGNKVVCLHSANEETPDESNILKIIDIL